jgi:hypothetical protein
MDTPNTGGPAFPVEIGNAQMCGISVRTLIAAIVAGGGAGAPADERGSDGVVCRRFWPADRVAARAVEVADALIDKLTKQGGVL